jgi:hypothetical protein
MIFLECNTDEGETKMKSRMAKMKLAGVVIAMAMLSMALSGLTEGSQAGTTPVLASGNCLYAEYRELGGSIVGFHGTSAIAQTIPWQEDFSTSVLDPSWQVMPGLGSYSLTDNPGHLRYYFQGPLAHGDGWMGIPNPGAWTPSLTLVRPFEGDTWILRAKVTYNIRWSFVSDPPPYNYYDGSTGAQYQFLFIAFGEGINDYLRIGRGTDKWYGTNILDAMLVSNGVGIASNGALLAPDDIPLDENGLWQWLRHTYWYEVVRNGQEITFRYSYDGTNYIDVFSTSLSTPVGATQKVIISAGVWATAGSYADWDYIYVESSIIPVTIDIKPGSFPNSINPKSQGKIPVAILTTGTFDATTVDPTTVLFGPTGTEAAPVQSAQEDVDGDGDTDMILHFNTQGTGIKCGDTSASLTGQTFSEQAIKGSDSIQTVGCK